MHYITISKIWVMTADGLAHIKQVGVWLRDWTLLAQSITKFAQVYVIIFYKMCGPLMY